MQDHLISLRRDQDEKITGNGQDMTNNSQNTYII